MIAIARSIESCIVTETNWNFMLKRIARILCFPIIVIAALVAIKIIRDEVTKDD